MPLLIVDSPIDLVLRPVTAADDEFLLRVYADTRVDELALTAWDQPRREAFVRMQYQAQAAHYRAHWPAAEYSVIEAHDDKTHHDVGRLWLHHRPDAIHVLDIAMLADWRGRGIGTRCLQRLMNEADVTGRAVTIHVESGNQARHLYARLGFQPVGEPDGLHQRMAWRRVPTKTMEVCDEQA